MRWDNGEAATERGEGAAVEAGGAAGRREIDYHAGVENSATEG